MDTSLLSPVETNVTRRKEWFCRIAFENPCSQLIRDALKWAAIVRDNLAAILTHAGSRSRFVFNNHFQQGTLKQVNGCA